ncbi:MAG: TolC family protein [Bacteroidaceae bacterium]|nr:TolC family protein [Bacteroidaceae bacterium]
MNYRKLMVLVTAVAAIDVLGQETWTLQQCLDYAHEHNIQLQKSRVKEQEGEVTLWQNKGQLFPSLNFNTQHGITYRPFEATMAVVQNGQVTNTSRKVTENSMYGLSASVTLWNGGINQKNIKAQELQNQITQLGTQQSELTLEEQITRYFMQILYMQEAKEVNVQLAETAKKQWERGQQMMQYGQMSKADVAKLESQYRSAEYDIVNAETQVLNYKRQLKAILELPMEQNFVTDGHIYEDLSADVLIPDPVAAYEQALKTRPEIRAAEMSIEAADMNLDIARRGYYPTIGASANLTDSHYSGSQNSLGSQMKTNLNMSAGVNMSVPIFDNRRNKSNVEKAKLQKITSQLDLEDQKKQLSSTIEELWLNATSSQQRYKSAQTNVKSQEASYELLNEQFANGLKNIVELAQGHDALVSAKQEELQSKYTTLLNMELLKLYTGEAPTPSNN